jgi:hypothetical protein
MIAAHPKPKAKTVMKWDESLSVEWKKKSFEKRKEAEMAQKAKEQVAKELDSQKNGVYALKSKKFDFSN